MGTCPIDSDPAIMHFSKIQTPLTTEYILERPSSIQLVRFPQQTVLKDGKKIISIKMN